MRRNNPRLFDCLVENAVTDRYLALMRSGVGRQLSALLGLPNPPRLRRALAAAVAEPLQGANVVVAAVAAANQLAGVLTAVAACGARVCIQPHHPGLAALKPAAVQSGVELHTLAGSDAVDAVVFDARSAGSLADLRALYDLLHPLVSRVAAHGRVVLIGDAADSCATPTAAALAQALTGFVRSLAKELGRRAITVNLITTPPVNTPGLDGVLRFLLSDHSTFITGQRLPLAAAAPLAASNWVMPLADRRAVVTGAARGIGAAIAQTLARDGARVLGIDRPQEEAALRQTMDAINGDCLLLDVAAASAGRQLREHCGPIDIVVHNAGVTRDRTLKNMSESNWDQVLEINLGAVLRITEELLVDGFRPAARVVCIASINGIAGAAGQTNYAASKAALMGYVQAAAPEFARRGGAINAVAPGFIETRMVEQMPLIPREFGRRLNSLGQGGLPSDVAEAVSFLAGPQASALNGVTLRVCGQNLVGA